MKNNMNIRKLLALLLAALMSLSLMACGEAGEAAEPTGTPTQSTEPVIVAPENPDEMITERSVFLASGATTQLTVNHNNVTFASSDTAVATVDGSGKVTAVGKGVALITVT